MPWHWIGVWCKANPAYWKIIPVRELRVDNMMADEEIVYLLKLFIVAAVVVVFLAILLIIKRLCDLSGDIQWRRGEVLCVENGGQLAWVAKGTVLSNFHETWRLVHGQAISKFNKSRAACITENMLCVSFKSGQGSWLWDKALQWQLQVWQDKTKPLMWLRIYVTLRKLGKFRGCRRNLCADSLKFDRIRRSRWCDWEYDLQP